MFASFVTGILFAALVNAELQLPGPPPNWDGVPPGFASVLSSDVIEQLKDVYKNQQLSMMEKKEQFDKIMDSVDPETLAKLPMPPFLSQLPKDVQEKLKAIHSDTEMKWSERAPKFMQIMDSLPEDMKPHFGPKPLFLPGPPPNWDGVPTDFIGVVPSDVIQQLKDVYKNQQLSMPEKKEQFDKIMDSVDPATLAKLPLPPFFNALPKDVQEKLQAMQSDTEMNWSERESIFEHLMDSLPEDMKPHFGPPPPPPSSAGAGRESAGASAGSSGE